MLRDRRLEAAIVEDPENRGAYEVYADWLVERGDPRGEWIHVELALETHPGDPALVARRADLLARHEGTWCGGLTSSGYWPTRPMTVTWRRGFLDEVALPNQYQSDESAMMYRELAGLPAAAALRALRICVTCSYGGTGVDDMAVCQALSDIPLPLLRSLVLDPEEFELSWTHVGDLSIANAALAKLERLVITAGRITLGAIDLPALRALGLFSGGQRRHVLASIAAAHWPALEELIVYFGTSEYGGDCTIADAQPLLAGANLPNVRSLGLATSEFSDELAAQLSSAKILPRLTKLDLSCGTLGAEGARAILGHAGAFEHLERLDLSDNYLSPELGRELRARLPNVIIGEQKIEDRYGRFVSVSE